MTLGRPLVARRRARYHFANEAPGWRFRDLIFEPEPEAERELELAELNRIRGPVALMQYWDVGDLPGASWRLLRLAFLHFKQSDPARALEVLAQIDIERQPRGALVDIGWGLSEKERAELVSALRAAGDLLRQHGSPEAGSCDEVLERVLATPAASSGPHPLTLDFLPPAI